MECCVRGYHVYQDEWKAAVGEEMECRRQRRNPADTYAVAVIKEDCIVGHLPRRISLMLLDWKCRKSAMCQMYIMVILADLLFAGSKFAVRD